MTRMQWNQNNKLIKSELQEAIRNDELTCTCAECQNPATDTHHLDRNHKNDNPSNLAPACKLCHNKEHGITAQMTDLKLLTRQFYDAQDQRKAIANRARAYSALGIETPFALAALGDAKEFESHLLKHIAKLLNGNDFYNVWLKKVKGIGPCLAANLLSEFGSPTGATKPSSAWHLCGLHVVNGEAPKRKKGCKIDWNPRLRVTAWKIGGQFVKTNGCFGRQLYDKYRAKYIARDGPEPKWQSHRRALRRVAKDFIRCFWVAWREHENLPVPEPSLGTWPLPSDWINE